MDMANWYGASRTNYFRVTDEEKYEELIGRLSCEDEIHDFSYEKDGEIWHGFGAYDSISFLADEDDEEWYHIDYFVDELSEILNENDVFICMCSGHEKLRYVTGEVIVATKTEKTYLDMETYAVEKAKELMNDSNFTTRVCY